MSRFGSRIECIITRSLSKLKNNFRCDTRQGSARYHPRMIKLGSRPCNALKTKHAVALLGDRAEHRARIWHVNILSCFLRGALRTTKLVLAHGAKGKEALKMISFVGEAARRIQPSWRGVCVWGELIISHTASLTRPTNTAPTTTQPAFRALVRVHVPVLPKSITGDRYSVRYVRCSIHLPDDARVLGHTRGGRR